MGGRLMTFRTDVKRNGAVLLSPLVCCDGFDPDRRLRVQSHIHSDHMNNFDRSKGIQYILMSNATKDFLISDVNYDIEYRNNIISLNEVGTYKHNNEEIKFKPAGHMLGSVQTQVTHEDGYKTGYSSDFSYPLTNGVLKCNELVVDSTYSTPKKQTWPIKEIIKVLHERIYDKLSQNSIIIQGHRGRLEYAMELIGIRYPDTIMIATENPYKNANIYRNYGYNIPELILEGTEQSDEIHKTDKNFIKFIELWESPTVSNRCFYKIYLSSHLCYDEPIVDYNEYWCKIALTDHAGFDDVINYIKATKSEKVVTDSSRGGNALELAWHIKNILGLEVRPASLRKSNRWGD